MQTFYVLRRLSSSSVFVFFFTFFSLEEFKLTKLVFNLLLSFLNFDSERQFYNLFSLFSETLVNLKTTCNCENYVKSRLIYLKILSVGNFIFVLLSSLYFKTS